MVFKFIFEASDLPQIRGWVQSSLIHYFNLVLAQILGLPGEEGESAEETSSGCMKAVNVNAIFLIFCSIPLIWTSAACKTVSNDFNRSQEAAEILSLALHRNSHKGSAQFAGGCFKMFPIVKTTRIWSAFSYSTIKRLGILDEPSKTSLSYPSNSFVSPSFNLRLYCGFLGKCIPVIVGDA